MEAITAIYNGISLKEVSNNYSYRDCMDVIKNYKLIHLEDKEMDLFVVSNPHVKNPKQFFNELKREKEKLTGKKVEGSNSIKFTLNDFGEQLNGSRQKIQKGVNADGF